MRVFITGMGGEIGTRVARLIEADARVTAVAGVDLEPPRRMLRRADFHFLDPTDAAALAAAVAEVKPNVVVHLGIYEPHSRSTPQEAEQRTLAGTEVLLGVLRKQGGVEHLVVRSGIEIYGRGPEADELPDEASPVDPTTHFGRILAGVEAMVSDAAAEFDATALRLRCAPISGAHMPSPIARYLRMPLVPVPLPPGKPFSLIHVDDVARGMAEGALRGIDDTLNLVGEGSINVYQALRVGGRLPLPVLGPVLRLTRVITELAGSPLPDHTLELLTRGRMAVTRRGVAVLGFEPAFRTPDVVDDLYDWSAETYLGPAA
jgi:UDP-glucose 4-epimerase